MKKFTTIIVVHNVFAYPENKAHLLGACLFGLIELIVSFKYVIVCLIEREFSIRETKPFFNC